MGERQTELTISRWKRSADTAQHVRNIGSEQERMQARELLRGPRAPGPIHPNNIAPDLINPDQRLGQE